MSKELKTFEVIVKCTVTKCVTCQAENKEDVTSDVWEYAIDEHEMNMSDFEIIRINEV